MEVFVYTSTCFDQGLCPRLRLLLGCAIVLIHTAATPVAAAARRPMALEDFYAIKSVEDVSTSPDGRWAVYAIQEIDREKNGRISSIWRVPVAGGAAEEVVRSKDNDRMPRFSPDGRYLAFVSDRNTDAWDIPGSAPGRGQVFLLPLSGGAPFPVTSLAGGVSSYRWSPDSRRLAVIARDPKTETKLGPANTPPVIVITRLRHKGGTEWLDDRKQHVYLVDLGDALSSSGLRRSEAKILTPGSFDEDDVAWSPDGRRIAFVSNRTKEPDANQNSDVWIVDVQSLNVTQFTTDPGADIRPAWSPDGSTIAYVHTPAKPPQYALPRLIVMPATGGSPRDLTGKFDRGVSRSPSKAGYPRWASDGQALYITFIDGGMNPLCKVGLDGSKSTVFEGDIQEWDLAADKVVAINAPPDAPADVFAAPLTVNSPPRNLSRANESLMQTLSVRGAESVRFKSADGTSVHGWLIKPPDFISGHKYPLIVWIHGGPVWHWTNSFKFEPMLFAARGYLVFLPNPRGSLGYGEAFSYALNADWGNLDYKDIMSGVDSLIGQGLVDSQRMGVGGWSYGGIMTNYIITKTGRFAAAVSGAGHSDLLSSFGTDDARLAWIEEFGYPWENLDLYRRLSSITQVHKVVTPTMFLYGERDFNCSPAQAEQMYVSLKTLGRETALILYPGEGHGLRRPSNLIDKARRYCLWFDKYLLGRPVDPTYHSWPAEATSVN
jgi:dipeptidyl aminopeptidase/acylaminoacyl peptidase